MRHVILAVFLLLSGLSVGCETNLAPRRPKGVPGSAVWAGGPDGGSWIECKVALDQRGCFCTVYDEWTGEVSAHGTFIPRDTGASVRADELKYEFFDGTAIVLNNGRILDWTEVERVPVGTERKTRSR